MNRLCNYCDEQLCGSTYFCNEECENNYRNQTEELYLLFKDGHSDWICPVELFNETEDELICHNASYKYTLNKSELEKWKIDKCSCMQEFTQVDVYFK